PPSRPPRHAMPRAVRRGGTGSPRIVLRSVLLLPARPYRRRRDRGWAVRAAHRARRLRRSRPPRLRAPRAPARREPSLPHHPLRTSRTRLEPCDDLVPDRSCDAGVGLDEDAVTDERHGRSCWKLARKLDRECVHRHGPDDLAALALDEDHGACEVAPEAVR